MFSLIFPRKQDLTFHENCLHWRQSARNVKACSLGKIRKIFLNVFCWNIYPEYLALKHFEQLHVQLIQYEYQSGVDFTVIKKTWLCPIGSGRREKRDLAIDVSELIYLMMIEIYNLNWDICISANIYMLYSWLPLYKPTCILVDTCGYFFNHYCYVFRSILTLSALQT